MRRPLLLLALAVLAFPASARAAGTTVVARSSSFGTVLFDRDGRALYLFTKEKPGDRPACYGACAEAWPPAPAGEDPHAGRGAREALVGSVRRRGGPAQLTYHGRPLYYYVGDTQPGQILCQDVLEFGGRWLIVDPRGRAVRSGFARLRPPRPGATVRGPRARGRRRPPG